MGSRKSGVSGAAIRGRELRDSPNRYLAKLLPIVFVNQMSAGLFRLGLLAWPLLLAPVISGAEPSAPLSDIEAELRRLQERHEAMQENLSKQQRILDDILRRASALDGSPAEGTSGDAGTVSPESSAPVPVPAADGGAPRLAAEPAAGPAANRTGTLRLAGHVAVVARRAGRAAAWRGESLRADEVRLEVAGSVSTRLHLLAELEVLTRERHKQGMQAGELYLEFAPLAEQPGLRVRAGRLDIPFGREHRRRDATANPLISHSAADVRGVDDGVQLQGMAGVWDWALALQSGLRGVPGRSLALGSTTLRLGYRPTSDTRFGLSALRTAGLSQLNGDGGPLWLGNALVRRLPGSGAPRVRLSGLAGDASLAWRRARLLLEGGALVYEDDDPRRAVRRGIPFLAVEAVQELGRGAYGALRYSRVGTASGFPLPGDGRPDETRLTESLERFSLGLGFRPAPPLLLKLEHTLNRGRWAGGGERTDENQTAAEAVLRF